MNGTTAVFGDGELAGRVAVSMAAAGSDVIVVARGAQPDRDRPVPWKTDGRASVEMMDQAECRFCRRTDDGFLLGFNAGGREIVREVTHVVLAEELDKTGNFARYGLKPGPGVLPLSRFVEACRAADGKAPVADGDVAFLTGLADESHPMTLRAVMNSALALRRKTDRKTIVFTGNLKVAAQGLDAMYRSCRKSGVLFVKISGRKPEIRQGEDSVTIEWMDPVTRQSYRFCPDTVVVDERLSPSARLKGLAKILEIDIDAVGFAQADNVHRLVVETNRNGIFAAGPSRDFLAPDAYPAEAACVALAAMRASGGGRPPLADRAAIRPEQCVRCLTCFRLCPYRAISIAAKMTVAASLCRRCGICAAECPAVAIHIPGLSKDALVLPALEKSTARTAEPAANRRIVAFCCTRSAVPAKKLAEAWGRRLPAGVRVVEVPCAGAVSLDMLLSAFSAGADGVMVLACHEGNCHSERGTVWARQRADELSKVLESMGIGGDRLTVQHLASGMATEFADKVAVFADRIRELAPVPIAREEAVGSPG